MKNTKTRTPKSKCPTCNRAWPTGNAYTPKPMPLDSRLKRATTSFITTLRLLADQRGKTAAKAALQKLTRDLALDE
jgi:hypothetical protein